MNRPARVVWMLSASFHPWIGGAERQLLQISKRLIARNLPVRVMTRRHRVGLPRDLPVQESVDGIPVTRLFTPGGAGLGSLLYFLGGFWVLLRFGRGQIYHAHGPGAPAWLAVTAARLLGGRSIIKVRSGSRLYTRLHLNGRLRAFLFTTPLKLASVVFAVSRDGVDFVRELGVREERIVLIPNGVDTEHFYPGTPEMKRSARLQLQLPADKTIVLFTGRLSLETKALDELIRAWAGLPEECLHESALILVGKGADRDRLIDLIASLGLSDSILIYPARPDVRECLLAADVFALPSRDEGLSNALLEAMASGLPVVASAVGGTPDVVQPGVSGLVYDPEVPGQLQEQLREIFARRASWPAMGQSGRAFVSAYAGLPRVVQQLEALYDRLTEETAAVPHG